MLARSNWLSGLGLLSIALSFVVSPLQGLAQTAVSAAQPAAPAGAPASATPASATPAAAPAPAAETSTEPLRSEMIHRTLYSIYDKQGNIDLAISELDELIKAKPNDPVFPFAYGQELVKQEKWKDAITRFQDAIKLDPNFSNAFCGVGDCQMKLKQYTAAVDSYSNASKFAKAGQNFTAKVAIAKQWEERKKQEDDFNAALKKVSGGGAKPAVKKK